MSCRSLSSRYAQDCSLTSRCRGCFCTHVYSLRMPMKSLGFTSQWGWPLSIGASSKNMQTSDNIMFQLSLVLTCWHGQGMLRHAGLIPGAVKGAAVLLFTAAPIPLWSTPRCGEGLQEHAGLRRLLAGQIHIAATPHERKFQQNDLWGLLHICIVRAILSYCGV